MEQRVSRLGRIVGALEDLMFLAAHDGKDELTTLEKRNQVLRLFDSDNEEIERLDAMLNRQVEIAHDLDAQITAAMFARKRLRAALERVVSAPGDDRIWSIQNVAREALKNEHGAPANDLASD